MDWNLASALSLTAAASCLLAVVFIRWHVGPSVALALALVVPALAVQEAKALETAPLLFNVLLAVLAFRLGRVGRQTLATVPVPLLAALPVTLALVGPFVLGGLAKLLRAWSPAAEPSRLASYLLVGSLLMLADGSGAFNLLRGKSGRSDVGGLSGLQAATAVLLLPLCWLFLKASASDAAPGWWEAVWGALPAALAALALGSVGGRLTRTIFAGSPQRTATGIELCLTLAAFALAEAIDTGLGPVAALASGLTTGSRQPQPEEDQRAEASWDWLVFAAAALIVAASGFMTPAFTATELSIGLALWVAAAAARLLSGISVAGLYRWLRPEELTWKWILKAAWLSYPGTMAVALVFANAPGERGEALRALLLPALCLSLLVEGGTAPLTGNSEAEPGRARRWEHARGRRIALRAAKRALELLEAQGDLDELTRTEKDDLFQSLGLQEKLVDVELEDLAQAQPAPARRARTAALYEVLRSAVRALEEAARLGMVSKATCDALRPEIIQWLKPDERPSTSEDVTPPQDKGKPGTSQ